MISAYDFGTAAPGDLYQSFLENDLEHADLTELALLAQSLGLSDQGDRATLIAAIKAYYRGKSGGSTADLQNPAPNGQPDTAPVNKSAGNSPPPATDTAGETANNLEITIESAAGARYFTIQDTDAHVFRLLGGVSLQVVEKNSGNKHTIRAEEILFDKDNEEMVARYNVEYSLDQGGEKQNFTGDEMRFSPSSGDALFLDGRGQKSQSISGTQQVFHIRADLIIRILRDILMFTRSELSSSVWTPDAYQIGASRIWVLSPGEWAMNDLVLYLGHIPVFYLPFFYIPPDELIFHPAVGERSIEGSYVQTTWYLVGRKESKDDGLSFLQLDSGLGEDYRLEPNGLFLRKVASKKSAEKKAKDEITATLATINLDYYSRLGYLGAFNLSFSGAFINKALLEVKLAATKRIYNDSGYTNFWKDPATSTYSEYWDASHLFGVTIPFRYGLNFSTDFKLGDWRSNIALSLPSDPYIESLYDNRAEDIDWSGLVGFSEDTTTTASTMSTASTVTPLTVTNSLALNIAEIQPYIKTLSLNKLDLRWPWSLGTWSATVNDADDVAVASALSAASVAAEMKFFFPGLLTLPDASLTLSGTLFQYPFPKAASSSRSDQASGKPGQAVTGTQLELLFPGDDVSTGAEPLESAAVASDSSGSGMPQDTGAGDSGTGSQAGLTWNNQPLDLANGQISGDMFKASLSYSFTPSGSLQARFKDSLTINDPYDIDAVPLYWMGNYGLTGSLNYSLGFLYDMITASGGAAVSRLDREVFGQSGELISGTSKYLSIYTSALDSAAAYDAASITQNNTVTLSPFKLIPFLAQTTIQYQLSELLYQHKYKSKTDGTYTYDDLDFAWDSTMVTAHSIAATLQAQEDWFKFSAGVTYALPPKDESIKYSAGLTLDFLTFSYSGLSALTENQWGHDPMNLGMTARLLPDMSLTSALVLDPEAQTIEDILTSWKTTFKYDVFSLWTTFKTDTIKEYVIGEGWGDADLDGNEIDDAALFQPAEIGSTLNLKLSPEDWWEGRIRQDLALNFSLKQSLLRATDSLLSYDFSYSFKLHEFLDLSFSLKGENSRIYRYFPGLVSTIKNADNSPLIDTIDIFEDLWNSLNIFDENALKQGNFKLKSLALKLTHDLGDWTLSFQIAAQPEITATTTSSGTTYTSSFASSFTFLLQWKPIEEIKQKMKYDSDDNSFIQVKS